MNNYQSLTVSVCMIVKDEEAVLERCLNNARMFADEIVVVDTGSTDATKSIARRYTGKVYDYVWDDDFAAARNFSYEKASGDYILWLDADDDIEAEDIERILDLKRHMPAETDVVFFTYTGDPSDENMYADGMVLRDRMIRRLLNFRWMFPIHEAIPINKDWKRLYRPDIRIFHRKMEVNESGRNLRIFERKISEGFSMSGFNLAYYCREQVSSGHYEKGIEIYSKLMEDGNVTNITYALPFYITAMKKLKRYEELDISLEAYLNEFGPYEVVLCSLGDLKRRKGDHEKAREYYQRALESDMDLRDLHVHFPAFHTFLPWVGLCKLYLTAGEIEKAEDALKKAAEIRPDNLNVLLLNLYLESRKGDKENE